MLSPHIFLIKITVHPSIRLTLLLYYVTHYFFCANQSSLSPLTAIAIAATKLPTSATPESSGFSTLLRWPFFPTTTARSSSARWTSSSTSVGCYRVPSAQHSPPPPPPSLLSTTTPIATVLSAAATNRGSRKRCRCLPFPKPATKTPPPAQPSASSPVFSSSTAGWWSAQRRKRMLMLCNIILQFHKIWLIS